jgi:endonuclease YncB( thermonuclease family)
MNRLIGPSLAWLLLCHISSHVSAQIIVRPPADVPQSLTGVPYIHDGDTVEIRGVKVRITGIDAPETDQRCLDANGKLSECGIEVRNQLIKKATGRQWTCGVSGKDRYGRSLASCHIDGEDIARWMVRSGLALSFRRYSHEYDAEETAAIEARAGLWGGAFIAPWDWRHRNTSTEILGSVSVPIDAQKDLLPAEPRGAPTPTTMAVQTPTTMPVPPPIKGTTPGPCQNPDDRAANGSRCGGRASSVRPGKGR